MKSKLTLMQIGVVAGLAGFIAGCSSPPPNISARQEQTIGSVEQTKSDYDTLGRRWGGEAPAPVKPAKPAPKPEPAKPAEVAKPAPTPEPAKTGCSDPTGGLVTMNQTMPAEVAMGSEFLSEIHVKAQACVANVVVRDTVPANTTYVRSEPSATPTGNQLVWQLGDMEGGESKTIKLWLKADKEGMIVSCASVSADPRTCVATRVVRPAIQLTKNAPAEAIICDPIPMTLTVKNTGSSALTGVKVNDPLPQGLSSEGKTTMAYDVGNLAPGESKEMKFNVTAARPGEYANKAQVTSTQGVKAEAASTTVVRQPVLTVACEAPAERYMGRPFQVTFKVESTGDAPAAGTVLQVPVPTGLTVQAAANGGQTSGGNIVWNLGSIAPKGSQQVTATFVSPTAGTFQFNSTAKGTCAKQVASSCQTRIIGVAGILLEKADDPDPVSVGETTTYTVKVTNQGTADDNNVQVVVIIPAELTPVSATGNGKIEGQKITFPVVPRLAPKEAVTYKVVAKGAKAGDGRTRFELNSDMLKAPVIAEESTHVY